MKIRSCRESKALVLVLLIGSQLFLSATLLQAETISQKQEQVDQIAAQLNTLENEIVTMEELSTALDNHIQVLNEQILSTNNQLNSTNNRLDRAERIYRDRLKGIYMNGRVSVVEIVLNAKDFRDFLVRIDFLSRISLMDAKMVQNINDEKKAVKKLMNKLSEQKRQQLSLQRKYDQDLITLQKKKAEMQTLLSQASAELKEMIQAAEAQRQRQLLLAQQNSLPLGEDVAIVDCTVYPYLDETFLTTARMPRNFKATGQKISGKASWYGNEFNGRKTSSGEIFNENDFTCAYTTPPYLPLGYPELPLGTYLAIRYKDKRIVVKVNDRGPFVGGRVFDLSKRAAQTLGYSGVVVVDAEVVIPQ